MDIFSSTFNISDNTTRYAKILEIKKVSNPFYVNSKLRFKFIEYNYQHVLVSTINVFITHEKILSAYYADNKDVNVIISEENDKWSIYVKANYLGSVVVCIVELGNKSVLTPYMGIEFTHSEESILNKIDIKTSISPFDVDLLDDGDEALNIANVNNELRYDNLLVAEYSLSENRRSELPVSGIYAQWRVQNIPCYWCGNFNCAFQIWTCISNNEYMEYTRKYNGTTKTWSNFIKS